MCASIGCMSQCVSHWTIIIQSVQTSNVNIAQSRSLFFLSYDRITFLTLHLTLELLKISRNVYLCQLTLKFILFSLTILNFFLYLLLSFLVFTFFFLHCNCAMSLVSSEKSILSLQLTTFSLHKMHHFQAEIGKFEKKF